ncbi:MAG TPA: ribonuclease III domain-containing protein [Methanomicrobiales archaeon]|nr:ribonuclease III domain-containing protein [Methanomicrobiales archaeon]
MGSLEENIGYHFRDPALLTRALTRKAFANEEMHQGRQHEDQEILSTLGDAALKAAFVDLLVRSHYPTPDAITREKESLERHDALAGIALQIGIGPSIRLGSGEKKREAEQEPYVLAETLEAIIGAIYLDGGCEAARNAVVRWYGHRIRPHPG